MKANEASCPAVSGGSVCCSTLSSACRWLRNVQVTISPSCTLNVALRPAVVEGPVVSPSTHEITDSAQPQASRSETVYCPGFTETAISSPSRNGVLRRPLNAAPVDVVVNRNGSVAPAGSVCTLTTTRPRTRLRNRHVTVSPGSTLIVAVFSVPIVPNESCVASSHSIAYSCHPPRERSRT